MTQILQAKVLQSQNGMFYFECLSYELHHLSNWIKEHLTVLKTIVAILK